jgi:hypothetical protein
VSPSRAAPTHEPDRPAPTLAEDQCAGHRRRSVLTDKAAAITDLLARHRLLPAEVCYVADDIGDLPAMRLVGLSVAVSDAVGTWGWRRWCQSARLPASTQIHAPLAVCGSSPPSSPRGPWAPSRQWERPPTMNGTGGRLRHPFMVMSRPARKGAVEHRRPPRPLGRCKVMR